MEGKRIGQRLAGRCGDGREGVPVETDQKIRAWRGRRSGGMIHRIFYGRE